MNNTHFNIAPVSTGYCPHCRTVVNLAETGKLEIACDRDEETETITIRTYHCEACHSFVFSERSMGNLSALKAKKPRGKIGFEVGERKARYRAGGCKGAR